MSAQKILCVEDDPVSQELLKSALFEYVVVIARTLQEAREFLQCERFDGILLDIQLPDGDGLLFYLDVVREFNLRSVPCIVLTGYADIKNKVAAFSFGVDDFLQKPFDFVELKARLNSKLKKAHAKQISDQSQRKGDVSIDWQKQKAFHFHDGGAVDLQLTLIELKILKFFFTNFEQVLSRNQILDSVWGNTYICDRTVDAHVARLRKKLVKTHLNIQTIKNSGYLASLTA